MTSFLFREDAIAAVATPPGRGAIGMIRISGPDPLSLLGELWEGRDLRTLRPRFSTLGRLVRNGRILDEVVLTWMKSPNSYTGEDVVEISCHGNPHLLVDILGAILEQGARPAEPGEFTFRAFRNGKLSLLQAESVAQLIEAKGKWARENALSVLVEKGDEWVQDLLDRLLEIWVPIEADLEFPTDDLDSICLEEFLEPLVEIKTKMEDLQARALRFSKLQEGYRVVLAGPPNAGKSTLFNSILGYNRALVTEIPGTTRDTLEEILEIQQIPVRLIDTAGLGETENRLDACGMERSRDAVERADLVLVVVDSSIVEHPPRPTDVGEFLFGASLPRNCPVIVVGNKMDLLDPHSDWNRSTDWPLVSATEGTGIQELLEKIGDVLTESGTVDLNERTMLNHRQSEELGHALQAVSRCLENIRSGASQDVVAADLIEAKTALENLSGKRFRVDLLEKIFSRFCIGK